MKSMARPHLSAWKFVATGALTAMVWALAVSPTFEALLVGVLGGVIIGWICKDI